MKCPYCNKDMESGFIKSSHRMHWGKEKDLGLLQNDIKLTKNSMAGFFEGNFVESHYCNNCNKIIVSLEENHI